MLDRRGLVNAPNSRARNDDNEEAVMKVNYKIQSHTSCAIKVETRRGPPALTKTELELELIQTQMTQKPMLRAEVGTRVRCANKASVE